MRIERPVLVALAAVACLALPVHAASLTFEQVSWLNSTHTGYVSQYSDWGQASLTLGSADGGLFSAMTVGGRGAGFGGFINIITDAGGAGDWNVKNLPIFFTDASELDGRLIQTVWFDLGVSPGTAVTNLNYYMTVSAAPEASMPAGSLASSSSVTEIDRLTAGATLWLGPNKLGGGGLASPAPAMNFPGAESGEVIGFVGAISPPENGVAAVSEDDNGCAPASAARSLQYLSDQHPEVTAPGTPQQMYDGMFGLMKTSTVNGTEVDDFLDGKVDYCVANGLPIMSTQTDSFAAAIDTLNRDGDVELGVYWGKDAAGNSMGGHATMVTEIQEMHDANGNVTGYVVKAVDDPVQGDGVAANSTHTYKFDAAGNLVQFDGTPPPYTGGGLITFQIEDVRKWLDPLEARWGGFGIVAMAPGGGLPRPVPIGPSAGPKTSHVHVDYWGTYDSMTPINPVTSTLVANPRDLPDAAESLELDLVDVVFTPVDPYVSTVITVSLTLTHLQADEITAGKFMPILSEDGPALLKNFIFTGSFFDATYQVHLPGEDPQVYRLHVEVPEELEGKVWIVSDDVIDPGVWIESFFDVSLSLEVTPDAYGLLGEGTTLLHMELHVDGVTPLLGDANRDGLVDMLDYTTWFENYGTGVEWGQANFKGAGVTDMEDYTTWFDNYGAGGAAVPEPATLLLLIVGGSLVRRRRSL